MSLSRVISIRGFVDQIGIVHQHDIRLDRSDLGGDLVVAVTDMNRGDHAAHAPCGQGGHGPFRTVGRRNAHRCARADSRLPQFLCGDQGCLVDLVVLHLSAAFVLTAYPSRAVPVPQQGWFHQLPEIAGHGEFRSV